jgi:hypothetical protein
MIPKTSVMIPPMRPSLGIESSTPNIDYHLP